MFSTPPLFVNQLLEPQNSQTICDFFESNVTKLKIKKIILILGDIDGEIGMPPLPIGVELRKVLMNAIHEVVAACRQKNNIT